MAADEYDYIVVGAGSAGCALAARLSEEPAVRVLLLEAGPRDAHWTIKMPAAFERLWNGTRFNWSYRGEPEPHLDGRSLIQPRGKVLGGSSSINGMCFIRGHPLDYERWVGEGAPGWSYREVLPYFRRMETWQGGANAYRGGDGPIAVRKGDYDSPLYHAFLEAGRQAGYPETDDINGAQAEGFGAFQMNVDRGRRASTAHAYLRPAAGRANLVVLTGAPTHRLIVSGNRVAGVAYGGADGGGEARARREVIVSAGTFNSPQLLMLSGIGPADALRRHDIPVRVDLPGVGANLQDHPLVYMKWECTEPVSISRYARPHRKALAGAQWALFGSGPAASNNIETMALMRSDPTKRQPDVMIQYLALILDHDEGVDPSAHGFTFCIGPVTEESRGRVSLRSADPALPPRILSNFLDTDADRALMRRSVRMGREVAGQRAYDRWRGREVEPGAGAQTDAEIDAYIRARAGTDFHPVGTCRMGQGRDAVVDHELRVHGIEGLRVADASIMPSIVAANTNATSIMIGERAADFILGRPPLPPAQVPLPAIGNAVGSA